tara:strand:+ start:124 stop:348 length:225 start_codon:yes stop_codon:yes gene_type:complete
MLKQTVSDFITALHFCEAHELEYKQSLAQCADEYEEEVMTDNWCAIHPQDELLSRGYSKRVASLAYKLWAWARL